MAIVYDSDDEKPNEKLDTKLQHDISEREKAKAKSDANNLSRTDKTRSDKFKDFLNNEESKTSTFAPSKKDIASKPVIQDQKVDRFSPIASTSRKRTLPISPSNKPQDSSLKKKKADEPISKETIYKPFAKLLEGVVLVISGIQVYVLNLCMCVLYPKYTVFRIQIEVIYAIRLLNWALNTSPTGTKAALI